MRKAALGALVALLLAGGGADAAEEPRPEAQDWSFDGIFGTFDPKALRRGLHVYNEVCALCHSLDLVYYRHLGGAGFGEDEVKAIAAGFEVPAAPDEEGATHDDEGERLMRKAKPADRFAAPFANENAARAANNGALPPDLSLITKARKHGPDYVFALLTRYREEPPADFELLDGMYYNEVFPGRQIAMSPPLDDEAVEYADGTEATLDQHARDVVAFLVWAAEPEMGERKRLGIKVMLFLIVLTAMLFALKRQIWSDLH